LSSPSTSRASVQARMAPTSTDKEEIAVVRQPSESFLRQKGVYDWGTWGCGVSKFPWSYDSAESCYLLAGRVTVTPSDGRKPATFGKVRSRVEKGGRALMISLFGATSSRVGGREDSGVKLIRMSRLRPHSQLPRPFRTRLDGFLCRATLSRFPPV
jgi:uncharacterized cupin superfamily protein